MFHHGLTLGSFLTTLVHVVSCLRIPWSRVHFQTHTEKHRKYKYNTKMQTSILACDPPALHSSVVYPPSSEGPPPILIRSRRDRRWRAKFLRDRSILTESPLTQGELTWSRGAETHKSKHVTTGVGLPLKPGEEGGCSCLGAPSQPSASSENNGSSMSCSLLSAAFLQLNTL